MVRHQSDVVRRDIRMSSGHPMAVGSEFRVGRVGWVTDILWIAVCYQGGGHFFPLDTNFIRAVGSSAALAESLGFNFPGLLVYMFVGVAIQKGNYHQLI
jgi:hypothetical protein